ncbi:MAG: DUF1570 domain-containing protein [Myxococcales bacterium]
MYRRSLTALALGFTLSAASCPKAPLGAGEGRWVQVESKHFILYTDEAPEDAREESRNLERLFDGLAQTGWEANGELKLRLHVVMFDNPYDFERYAKFGIGGYHVPDVLYEPWIVLPAARGDHERLETVAHELTHYMAHAAMPRQPRWFAEGLACYFESGHVDEDRFVLGSVSEDRYRAMLQVGLLRPSELISERATHDDIRFYSSSWLLVHYLMNNQSEAFQEYQKGLGLGLPSDQAWRRAFPGLSDAALDREVEDYVMAGRYARFSLPFKVSAVSLHERVLSRADEHALQAVLWLANFRESRSQDEERARAAVELALALDPQHLMARTLQIDLMDDQDTARALASAKELVERHPQEWLPRVLLGRTAWAQQEAIPVDSPLDPGQAVAIAPWQAQSWLVLASQQALRGKREQAIKNSARAQTMAPADPEVLWIRLTILMRLGACDEAVKLAELLRPHLAELDARARLEFTRIKKQCAASASDPPGPSSNAAPVHGPSCQLGSLSAAATAPSGTRPSSL